MKKSYEMDCPVARTLDVIGERWTALILRDLFLNKSRRFQDFQESLAIAPNTLSDRLKALESSGIIEAEMGQHGAAGVVLEAMLTVQLRPYPRRILVLARGPR